MYEGSIIKELSGDDITNANITKASLNLPEEERKEMEA